MHHNSQWIWWGNLYCILKMNHMFQHHKNIYTYIPVIIISFGQTFLRSYILLSRIFFSFFFCYKNLGVFIFVASIVHWQFRKNNRSTQNHSIYHIKMHHRTSDSFQWNFFFTSYRLLDFMCVYMCDVVTHRLSSYSMQWNNVYKLIITQPIHLLSNTYIQNECRCMQLQTCNSILFHLFFERSEVALNCYETIQSD